MIIVNQKKTGFYSTDGMVEVNVAPSKDGYASVGIFMNCINDGVETHRLLGRYKDEQDAKYVLMLIYDAHLAECDFEMPAKDDIPDLRILKSRGGATSIKASHGKS